MFTQPGRHELSGVGASWGGADARQGGWDWGPTSLKPGKPNSGPKA